MIRFLNVKPIALLLLAATAVVAQVPQFGSGVGMGHLHLNVRDIDASKQFWAKMGGTSVVVAKVEIIKIPGVLILLKKAEPTRGTQESVVQHIGFKVKDLSAYKKTMREAGFTVEDNVNGFQAYVFGPDQLKIELSEDKALTAPIINHHIHFYTKDVDATQAWYVKTFGAVPGMRAKFKAADLPGVNLTFSLAEGPDTLPTKGRVLDHIGFEVKDLEAFCKKLEASGVKLDVTFRKVPSMGITLAFLTDPFGTYIELTEGLDKI
jgi:catechol 2,3-dioxygenase-like lactoylglutathione lyase family enzyme